MGQGPPGARAPQAADGPHATPERPAALHGVGQGASSSTRAVLCKRLHATLRGDAKAYGVHGNAASLQQCCNRAMGIVRQWVNRRSQRHSETWQSDTAVLERCKGARPRMVGRPKTRQAALKTSAALRQRVLLKSPVRKNRAPGSVRGPSGNRRSYRDGPTGERETASLRRDNPARNIQTVQTSAHAT